VRREDDVRNLAAIRRRKAQLEREMRLCRSRVALLRAQYASEELLLHWLERLGASQEELEQLRVQETEASLRLRRERPRGVPL